MNSEPFFGAVHPCLEMEIEDSLNAYESALLLEARVRLTIAAPYVTYLDLLLLEASYNVCHDL